MNRQLSRLDFLFATRIRNEPFGQFRTFTVGNHPAHHIAAEDVEDHVEIEICPLRGTEQFRDIPAPELVGASGQQFRLRVSRVHELVAALTRLARAFENPVHGANRAMIPAFVEPAVQMYFLEDVLPPEQVAWYRNIRQVCSTPQAIGEVFSHPLEVIPLITDRLIDFVRCRVAAMGGITPVRKLTVLCETFGVKTAFQEGGENDPVNQLAAYHIDLSSSAFGIQEENHFPPVVHDMFPGMAEIRRGYLYDSGKPGIGIDEGLAAKHPLGPIPNGGAYKTDRTIDG